MANFNDFEDVRAWVRGQGLPSLREQVGRGAFAGKTAEVAQAYIAHVDEHGYDVVDDTDDDEDDDPKWTWRPWRIAIVAAFVIGPPLLVWAINAWAK